MIAIEDEQGNVQKFAKLTEAPLTLPPNTYMAFTADKEQLARQYPQIGNIVETPGDLPAWGTSQPYISLRNAKGLRVDSLRIEEQMFFSLIDEEAGVSLERLSMKAPSQNNSNWHSAASTAGWGTPGLPNSQKVQGEEACWKPSNKVFTPNQDGFEDFMLLHYSCQPQGAVVNAYIMDLSGKTIKHWVQQAQIGTEGFFRWDGEDAQGGLVPPGIYIIYMEIFTLEGKTKAHKLAVGVGY
jgi:hypothetical protein